MKRLYVLCAAGAIAAAGCTSSSTPAQPSAAAAPVDASLTASVTAPRPVSPAAGAVFRNTDQPVTLVVANAAITQGSASYTFEVATDAAFASKVFSKSGVVQTATQTALTIDRLTAGTDYYWRARADAGGTTGPFSAARKFTIGPAVQIDPPTPVSPTNGATTQGWPGLTVKNSTRSGPAGAIVYRFELSNSATFSNIVLSGTVAEANTNTTFVPPSSTPAPSTNTVFWRVTAIDQTNSVSSPVSSTSSFVY